MIMIKIIMGMINDNHEYSDDDDDDHDHDDRNFDPDTH